MVNFTRKNKKPLAFETISSQSDNQVYKHLVNNKQDFH